MVCQVRNSAFFLSFLVLFDCSLWAQHPHTDKAAEDAISHVRNLLASSLDGNLPKVTLEFFLKYEGEGAPIKWSTSNCDQQNRSTVSDHERDSLICVKAEIDLKGNRAATVVVSLGKGGARPADIPTVFSVTVTDQDGSVHDLRRLSDLPMELHRPLPKGPRDLHRPSASA